MADSGFFGKQKRTPRQKSTPLTWDQVPVSKPMWDLINRAREAREEGEDVPFPFGPGQLWNFLLYLYEEANNRQRFQMNVKYVARKYGVSVSEAQRMIQYLEECSALESETVGKSRNPHILMMPLSGVSRQLFYDEDQRMMGDAEAPVYRTKPEAEEEEPTQEDYQEAGAFKGQRVPKRPNDCPGKYDGGNPACFCDCPHERRCRERTG
jgi:hypothetical protein